MDGIIHYLAITCHFVDDYITVMLNALLAVRLIILLINIGLSLLKLTTANYKLCSRDSFS